MQKNSSEAATTCGNICALVDDTRDLLPFISILLPELNKCEEHSHPDLRKCAVKAKESLLKGLDDQNLKGGKSSSSYICDALEASSIKIRSVVLTRGSCGGLDVNCCSTSNAPKYFVSRYLP